MAGFADLIDAPDASAPPAVAPPPAPAKKSFAALVDQPKSGKRDPADIDPALSATFQVGNVGDMRTAIANSNEPEKAQLLAALDAQFPRASAPVAPPDPSIPQPHTGPYNPPAPEPSLWERMKAAGQAGANTIIGGAGGTLGALYGGWEAVGHNTGQVLSGNAPNMDLEKQMALRGQQFTPELPQAAQTPLGQDYTQQAGDALQSVMGAAPTAEFAALAHSAPSVKQAAKDVSGSTMDAARDVFAKKNAPGARIEPSGVPDAPGGVSPGSGASVPTDSPVIAEVRGTGQTVAEIARSKEPAPAVPPTPEAPLQRISINPTAAPAEAFADVPSNGATALPLPAQSQRAQVLQSVGLDTARKSSLEASGLAASTDAQTAKLDTPAGNAMKAQLENERQTLNNYADNLVRDTGGTTTADQAADYARGTNITDALDSLKGWYDGHISTLYKMADERAQGVPTNLDSFRTVLGDDSQMTNSDRVHLRGAVQAYAKKLGIIADDGSIFANAQQAETMRKYLGENWTPQNGRFVSALKDALDDGVTQAAGEDVYAAARQMRAERGKTLDNPNGIAKIMDSSGPNGINRSVAIEKVPTAISSMPVDQLRHVVETLREAPPEIQPQAQSALAEIKAHFANQVRNIGGSQSGQFNAKGVGNYLRSNAARMNEVFTPQEMQGFQNLHQAGQILAKDQSYPGAAVQGHNLLRAGAMAGVQAGATAAGAAVGGPLGASVGSYVGGKAAQKMGDAASLKAVRGRMTRLSDFPQ